MKHIIFIIYLITGVFCFGLETNSQTITWRRTYHTIVPSGSGLEGITAIAQTDDRGYIAVGRSRQVAGGNSGYMFAMGINPYGDSLWFKVYNNLQAEKIVKVNDGNYVIMSLRAELVKINSIGDTIWTKVRTEYNLGCTQIKYLNNEFYICGQNRNNEKPFLLKLDSLGNDIYYVEYNYFIYGFIRDFVISKNDIILTGEQVWPKMFIIKTDFNGNLLWLQNYELYSYGLSLINVPSYDSVIVGGFGKPLNSSGNSAFLMKFDTSGNLQWHYTYDPGNPLFGGIDFLLKDKNGGIISLGESSRSIQYPHEHVARLIKFDFEGAEIWRRQYGFENDHFVPNCFAQTNDSGYIFGGIIRDSFHIVKTDKFGNVPVSIQNNEIILPARIELYQNYPNPFNSSTVIRFENRKVSDIKISLYNTEGKLIETIVDNKFGIGVHSIVFQPKNLSSGIYYYFLSSDDLIITKKLVYLK